MKKLIDLQITDLKSNDFFINDNIYKTSDNCIVARTFAFCKFVSLRLVKNHCYNVKLSRVNVAVMRVMPKIKTNHESLWKPRGLLHERTRETCCWNEQRLNSSIHAEKQMSPNDTMLADSIGGIVKHSDLASFSHVFSPLWTVLPPTSSTDPSRESGLPDTEVTYLTDSSQSDYTHIFDPYQLREIARKSSRANENCLNDYVAVLFYGCKPASKSKKYVHISDLFEASRYKTIPKSMYFPFIINTLYHVILLTKWRICYILFHLFSLS